MLVSKLPPEVRRAVELLDRYDRGICDDNEIAEIPLALTNLDIWLTNAQNRRYARDKSIAEGIVSSIKSGRKEADECGEQGKCEEWITDAHHDHFDHFLPAESDLHSEAVEKTTTALSEISPEEIVVFTYRDGSKAFQMSDAEETVGVLSALAALEMQRTRKTILIN